VTSTADLVVTCREDYLQAGASSQLTKLTTTIDSSTETVVVDSVAGIGTGSRICIGYEEMHVWSVATLTLTVTRGLNGSTAAAHTAGDIITIDPEYSDAKILRS